MEVIKMKTLKCEICGTGIKGKDFDSWFQAAHKHWGAKHTDVMESMKDNPNAKAEQQKWVADKKKEFNSLSAD